MMDDMEADVLAYMGFPQAHRAKLASSNPIERLNGEIKPPHRCGRHLSKRGRNPPVGGVPSCWNRTTNGRCKRGRYMTLRNHGRLE